jgi:alkanesulfonate monooxygenase SsuD/methylene tetrahydromethanopterin reductase-like flavin-dependent oxidoreductase (luciferase family)
MRFSVWPNAAGSWEDLLDIARHAEATGWDGIWIADHFMPNTADAVGPTNECWTTVAALAASVPRVRLGTLVTGNTYRHPAVLAKMAANVDMISGGRLVLGLGSGWQENEHSAYGIPFHTIGGRLNRLDEACQVIRSLKVLPANECPARSEAGTTATAASDRRWRRTEDPADCCEVRG